MTVREKIEDRAYFTRRAREERERAVTCEENAAALVHLKLAEEYERRAATVEIARSSYRAEMREAG